MGVIGPDNQPLGKRSARRKGGLQSALYDGEDEIVNFPRRMVHEKRRQGFSPEEDSYASEALSMFPHPKSLITRVIQVATSSNRIRVCSFNFVYNSSKAVVLNPKPVILCLHRR